jgi:hypothetical protein
MSKLLDDIREIPDDLPAFLIQVDRDCRLIA